MSSTQFTRWAEQVWLGQNEKIPYSFDAADWSIATPVVITVTAYEILSDGSFSNVSGTFLSGSASVSGSIITLPFMQNPTKDTSYLVRLKFSNNGSGAYELLIPVVGQE